MSRRLVSVGGLVLGLYPILYDPFPLVPTHSLWGSVWYTLQFLLLSCLLLLPECPDGQRDHLYEGVKSVPRSRKMDWSDHTTFQRSRTVIKPSSSECRRMSYVRSLWYTRRPVSTLLSELFCVFRVAQERLCGQTSFFV